MKSAPLDLNFDSQATAKVAGGQTQIGAAVNRQSLNCEDRRTFDRWVAFVAAFYGVLALCLLCIAFQAVQIHAGQNVSAAVSDKASDIAMRGGQHR